MDIAIMFAGAICTILMDWTSGRVHRLFTVLALVAWVMAVLLYLAGK